MLAYAHKTEPFVDDVLGPVDPVDEVRRQASSRLGAELKDYGTASDDSSQQLPRGSALTFVPEIDGIEFNPSRRSFLWLEPVHQEEFRMRAGQELNGKRARGRLFVYFGSILIAEVSLTVRVSSGEESIAPVREDARPYRKIFISYSHRDKAVVEQVETFLAAVGDEFLRDARDLRAGEVWEERVAALIREADVFQLFWSTNSMQSPFVRREWSYALSLNRPSFVRPTYWEQPLPEIADQNLPPDELRRLHFRYLPAVIGAQAVGPTEQPSASRPPSASARPTAVHTSGEASPSVAGPAGSRKRSLLARLSLIGTTAAAAAVAFVVLSSALRASAPKADFARTAPLLDGGRAVKVGGPISCPANDTVSLSAAVSQPAGDALARGSWSHSCTGGRQHWKMTARLISAQPLAAGCSLATGIALTSHAGKRVNRFTWQSRVRLTAAYGGTASEAGC